MGRDLDEFDLFEKEEAARRMARREEMREKAAEQLEQQERAEAIRRERSLLFTRDANKHFMMREYQ